MKSPIISALTLALGAKTILAQDGCTEHSIVDQLRSNILNYETELVTLKSGKLRLKVACKKPKNKQDGARFKDVKAYKEMMQMMKDTSNTDFPKWGNFKCNNQNVWVPHNSNWGEVAFCPKIDEWYEYQQNNWVPIPEDYGCITESLESMIIAAGYDKNNYVYSQDIVREINVDVVSCKAPVNKEDKANFADVQAYKAFTKYIEENKIKRGNFKCGQKGSYVPLSKAELPFPFECPATKDWKTFWEDMQADIGNTHTTVVEETTTPITITEENELTTITQEPQTTSTPSCPQNVTTVGSPYYVDANNGNDNFQGTSDCPFKSFSAAVALLKNDDIVYIRDGSYYEFNEISFKRGIKIIADGENVTFDGTKDIKDLGGVWEPYMDLNNGTIYKISVNQDAWQLFVDRYEQVPARWPNANFMDGSVFDYDDHWGEGTMDRDRTYNPDTYPYVNGELIDMGELAESGIDPTGAIAILNIGSWRTTSERVTSWDNSTNKFTYNPVPNSDYFAKHHYYFLEQKLELLDVEGEWFFDPEAKIIYFMPPNNMHPNVMDIRVKTQAFAMKFTGCDQLYMEGINFFGTTFYGESSTRNSKFTDLRLTYPSTSKRSLGIAREGQKDRYVTRFMGGTSITVERSAFLYTDGPAIEFFGSGYHNLTNNYFYHIDWSVADETTLGQTVFLMGKYNHVTHNTFHKCGASQTIVALYHSTITHNHIYDAAFLQTDGSPIHLMGIHQNGSEIAYNWVHDTQFYGIRLDGLIDAPNVGRNCSVHHNVAWNNDGGIMIKGNDHHVFFNTVFGERPYHPKAYKVKNDMTFTSGLIGEDLPPEGTVYDPNDLDNSRTYSGYNAANTISGYRTSYLQVPGVNINDFVGYFQNDTVENQLIDIENFNFCPQPNSKIAEMGVGAYDADCANNWVAGHTWDVNFTPPETGPVIEAPVIPTIAPPILGPCQAQFEDWKQRTTWGLDQCNNCCLQTYEVDGFNDVMACYNRCLYYSGEIETENRSYKAAKVDLIPNGGGVTGDAKYDDLSTNSCNGTVIFVETSDQFTTLYYKFQNCLPEGKHGLAVHKHAIFTEGCASTSWHYNPNGTPHGPFEADKDGRHAGGFGNIEVDAEGNAEGYLVDHVVRLSHPSIIGRSLVVHEKEDNFKWETSAGVGLACGEIVEDLDILNAE